MSPERRYVLTVAVGVAAFALALALEAHATVVVATGVVYATAAYLTADHPDLLWGREGQQNGGVVAGASAVGMLGLVGADVSSGVVVLALGLLYFGFAAGASYARDAE
ncbi:hypothetical protein [Halobacterium litoreum]|uniref:Uncharacterized protein n=1 Tax=Halobacterium litoreum TaxID=2039234 RepID=A0ABD5NF59_9EURY|nr:hypothetical protein [Halobacterium litoreum]UHH13624.1 hypothetical protein LT972_01180 [Halobacterium litoreum]